MSSAGRRVAVFIDYQNCYGWARRAFFGAGDPQLHGHFKPLRFAELLAGKGPGRYQLVYTGVYCGLPDATKDPQTHSARRKQMASWTASGVTVVPRALRYPHGWTAGGPIKSEEKGIDVKLSIDAVMMALRGEYDIGIIASCDSDLTPTVEALIDMANRPVIREVVIRSRADAGEIETVETEEIARVVHVEVIAWVGTSTRISVAGQTVTTRWVGDKDFRAVQDTTAYSI